MPGYDKLLEKVGLKSGIGCGCAKGGAKHKKSMKKGGAKKGGAKHKTMKKGGACGKKHAKGGMSCGMRSKSMKKGGMKHKTMKKLHPRKVHHKKPNHMKLRVKTMKMKKGMKGAPKGLLFNLRKTFGL
jgi:hypothetical protein